MKNSITFVQSRSMRSARQFRLLLTATILIAIGCSPETPLSVSDAQAEAPVVQQTESVTPAEPVAQSYSEKLAAALEKATAAKDVVMDQLSAASESGGQAASDSVNWATEMFNNLKEQGLTKAENTQQWLADDWKHAGAWEYHVVAFDSNGDPASALNELGKDRWECFHVGADPTGDRLTFYFKRPAKSYLNNLPMKDLMHLLPLMGTGRNNGP